MGNPVSKNPLITKWSTIFDILRNKTEIGEAEIQQMVESTGFTVSALYEMLGLTASNKTSDDFTPLDEAEDPSTISNNGSTLDNVHQFTANGPILVRNSENPKKYIINPMYNAGLEILFNGQELVDDNGKKVGKMITKIDLAGTVTAIGKGSGLVKIQIGENMNSSGWNIVDGKGSDGTVPDFATTLGRVPEDTNAGFSMGNWAVGTSAPFTTSSSITYTSYKTKKTTDTEVKDYKVYTSDAAGNTVVTPTAANIKNMYERDGYVHLNDGANIWTITIYGADGSTVLRKATVTDTVKIKYSDKTIKPTDIIDPSKDTYAGSSTGALQYVTGSNGISTAIDSRGPFEVEFNYPSAVGARIIRNFTINLEEIVPNGDRVKVVIELNGNKKEQTLFYLQGATPVINDLTLAVSTEKFVYYSGVKYYGAGTTFKLTSTDTSITNLNNQLGIGSGAKLDLSDTSTQDATALALFNTSTYADIATGTFSAPLTNYSTAWNDACGYSKDGIAVLGDKYITTPSITMVPKNAFASGTGKKASVADCLVNTWDNDSTDLVENFKSETYRRTEGLAIWTDTNKQTSLLTSGNTDLQIIPGVGLCYPSKNYTGFTPSALNYTNCTGDRSYIRLFKKAGSLPGGTLTFSHNASIKAGLDAGNMRIYGSKDGSTWFDISYATPDDANTLGQAASVFNATSSNIVFLWRDGDANGQFYVKIVMKKGFTPIITKIQLI